MEEGERRYHYFPEWPARAKSVSRPVFMVPIAGQRCDNYPGGYTKLEFVRLDVGILVSESCNRFLPFSSNPSVERVLDGGI